MSSLKEILYKELKLKVALGVEGVSYDDRVAQKLIDADRLHRYEVHNINSSGKKKFDYFPNLLVLKHGFAAYGRSEQNSLYEIIENNGTFGIAKRGEYLTDISFTEEPEFYYKKTSDGTLMKDIARDASIGGLGKSIVIAYSDECSVKDKGETCLFCSYNSKVRKVGEDWQNRWKNPGQIAEVVKEAYSNGYTHVTITGGFVPERRELEYYIDVAEAIKEALGTDTFNGTACIGAPLDLTVIDKYKEAGYSSIAFNTEVWRKEWFNIINPGKVSACGGYDNWIRAIEYAVKVFGKGNVRSNFVVGLQPKEVLFEGLEYLASIGVVTIASSWVAAIGSPLEGHRTPTVDWHWDVQLKHAQILRKYGRTYDELFNAAPARFIQHDIYQIEDKTWPAFQEQLVTV